MPTLAARSRASSWLLFICISGAVVSSCSVASKAPEASSSQRTAAGDVRSTAEELGSTRNSKVAIERGAGAEPLTFFVPAAAQGRLGDTTGLGPGVRVVIGLSREEALTRAQEAHGIDASYASPAFVAAATNLAWVHTSSAGVDHLLAQLGSQSDRIVVTNSRAVHGPAIADHVFAMLLSLTRSLPTYLEAQRTGQWIRDEEGGLPRVALQGRTLLVVGLGGIGTEIARRGAGFGMRVIGTRRSDDPAPDFVERVGKPNELLAMLPEADVVALAVPLTPETEHMFNAAAFAAMKPGSYLINIARGKVVETAALMDALTSGRLAGAGLDVTDPEPLPSDHALWKLPNVIITPHMASRGELTVERGAALYRENLRRFAAGEPLLNVVDKAAGY
ncbi:MAG: D-2-hydroxyacid dehydrogenase [Gemmatimonadales bacterium]